VRNPLRARVDLPRPDLPQRPDRLEYLVAHTPGHLARRHPRHPARVPPQSRNHAPAPPRCLHTRTGLPLMRLSPTAIVALVVASSEARPIGIGPPVRAASTK